MSRRRAKRIASVLVALAVGLHVGGLGLYVAGDALAAATTDDLLTAVITLTFCAIGTLVAVRHPGNAIGWRSAVCSERTRVPFTLRGLYSARPSGGRCPGDRDVDRQAVLVS